MKIIQYFLNLDPDIFQELKPWQCSTLELYLTDLDFSFYLSIGEDDVDLTFQPKNKPRSKLSGTSLSLMQLGLTSNSNDARRLMADDIDIEGDVEFAQAIKLIFNNMHIDWEEHLANITGDVIAHEVANQTKGVQNWLESFKTSSILNVTEYLQEEIRLLPPRAELRAWSQQVDRLIMDVDRLSARIERCIRKEIKE